MFTMSTTFIGIAVKDLKKEVPAFETSERHGKTLIGVPFSSGIPINNIKNYLVEEGIVEEKDIIGNFSYLSEVTMGKQS